MRKPNLVRNVRWWGIQYINPKTLYAEKEISFNGGISYNESMVNTRYKNKLCRLNGGPSRIRSDGGRDWFKVRGNRHIRLHTRLPTVGNNKSYSTSNVTFTRIPSYGITRKSNGWGIFYRLSVLWRDKNQKMSNRISCYPRHVQEIYYNGTTYRQRITDSSSFILHPRNIGSNGYRAWTHSDMRYIWSELPEKGGNPRRSWGNKIMKMKAWKYKNGN